MKEIKSNLKSFFLNTFYLKESILVEKMTKDIRPIYHIHIRKTAGTTINMAFLSNFTDKPSLLYDNLSSKLNHRIIVNDKVVLGWNKSLINQNNFHFAFSHLPIHKITLAKHIFRFTCLRDPVKRILSHYNMLRYYKINRINHPCMKEEGAWVGDSLHDFLTNIPKTHLLNQLYMFSDSFNVDEALSTLDSLDKIVFTEELSSGLSELEVLTGLTLPISNQKKYNFNSEIDSSEYEMLMEYLKPEYDLLNLL